MKYAAIKSCDIANGPGVRVSLFVSGCRHHCKDCFNPETWDFAYGQPFDEAVMEHILALMAPDYIRGITYLGGEPFEPENQRELLPFIKNVKVLYPNKTIWCYTGNNLEHEIWQPGPGRCSTPICGNLFRMSRMAVVACSRFSVERCSTDSAEKSYSSAPLQEMAGSDRRMFPSAARMDSGGRPVATVKSPPMPVYSWMTARLQAGMPSLAVSSVLSISQITRVSLRGGFMRDVPFLTVSETL